MNNDQKKRTELIRALQSILIALGYDVGPCGPDGRMGPHTGGALRRAAGAAARDTEVGHLRQERDEARELAGEMAARIRAISRGPFTWELCDG